MASFLDDPNMQRYMGQIGLGVMASAQAQPYGVNRYSLIQNAMQQANQGLMQSRMYDMQKEQYDERKKDRMSQKSALSKLFGGPDPATGITWDQGREGMSDAETMSLVGQVSPEAAITQMLPKAGKGYTLGPGQTRFGPEGEEVASVPPTPVKPENVSAITLRNTENGESVSLDRRDPRLKKFLGPDSPWVEESRTRTGELSAGKVDELTEGIDLYDRAITGLDDMVAGIKENRSSAGLVGTATRLFQEGIGMATDLSEMGIDVPGAIRDGMEELETDVNAGRADPAIFGRFFNKALPENDVFENRLAYVLAKSRKGGGRLNIQDVQNAKADVKLTGLRSVDSVLAKLNAVKTELSGAREDLSARRGQEPKKSDSPVYEMQDGVLVRVE